MSISAGDFNSDGIPDLAVANFGTYYTSGDLSILLGLGDGSFAKESRVGAGFHPASVVSGDFNGDEIRDLAIANGSRDTILAVPEFRIDSVVDGREFILIFAR